MYYKLHRVRCSNKCERSEHPPSVGGSGYFNLTTPAYELELLANQF